MSHVGSGAPLSFTVISPNSQKIFFHDDQLCVIQCLHSISYSTLVYVWMICISSDTLNGMHSLGK